MTYNEFLSDRIAQFLNESNVHFYEKKMFGGLCFMVNDKMFVVVIKDEVMARINPDIYRDCLGKKGCKEVNFKGKPMKGFVLLTEEAIDLDEDFKGWLQLTLDYNPLARASKKKTPK